MSRIGGRLTLAVIVNRNASRGRTVRGDVAGVGYDGILLAALVTPPLTTRRVPRYKLGAEAMRCSWPRLRAVPTAVTKSYCARNRLSAPTRRK